MLYHAVCAPGLTLRLGLSSWAAMYPHRREMLHMTFLLRFFWYRCHLSIAYGSRYAPPHGCGVDQKVSYTGMVSWCVCNRAFLCMRCETH